MLRDTEERKELSTSTEVEGEDGRGKNGTTCTGKAYQATHSECKFSHRPYVA